MPDFNCSCAPEIIGADARSTIGMICFIFIVLYFKIKSVFSTMSEYSPPMFLTYTCAIYYIFRYYKTLSVRLICLTGGDRYFVSCISFMVMFRISSMSLSSLLFQHSTDLFVKVGINPLGLIDNLSRKLPFPASSGHHPAQILYGYTR